MIVLSLTNCPPKLRGDLSKWLMEISTGVYVGNVSARVREALWKRITDTVHEGQAVMVCSANNEQGMTCRVHHTTRIPADYDGYTLMKLPASDSAPSDSERYQSTAHFMQTKKKRGAHKLLPRDYVILDLETTGLSPLKDSIIEIGVAVIHQGSIQVEYSRLIRYGKTIPEEIQALTGITDKLCEEEGALLADVLNEVYDLIDEKEIICWHASFDIAFLEYAFERNHFSLPDYHFTDAEGLVRKLVHGLPDYKMLTVAEHLGISNKQLHRALPDCRMLYGILNKLNEIS